MKAGKDRGAILQRTAPAHVARVLSALRDRALQAQPHPGYPIRWDAPYPVCGGPLELRDVNWQDRDRRVVFYRRQDDEPAILTALGLRDRDLFLGGDGRSANTKRATSELVKGFTRALGAPIATPDRKRTVDGRLELARYRVHRWRCPACGAGWDDPIYRPMVVDSDGNVWCAASGCSATAIAVAARELLADCDEPEVTA